MLFIRKVYGVVKQFWFLLVLSFLVVVIEKALTLLIPQYASHILEAINKNQPFSVTIEWVKLTLFVTLAHLVLEWTRPIWEQRFLHGPLELHVAMLCLQKLDTLSLGQYRSGNSGEIQEVVRNGKDSLPTLLFMILYSVIPICLESLGAVVMMFFVDWRLGVILFVSIIGYLGYIVFVNNLFSDEIKADSKDTNSLGEKFSEIVNMMPLIRITRSSGWLFGRYSENVFSLLRKSNGMWSRYCVVAAFRDVWSAFAKAAGYLLAAWLAQVATTLTPAQFFKVFLWFSMVYSQLWNLSGLSRQIIKLKSRIDNFFELLELEPGIKEPQNPVLPPGGIKGEFQLDDVFLEYESKRLFSIPADEVKETPKEVPEKLLALKGVTLQIPAGKFSAFVGPSGGGKSSILSIFQRAQYPTRGEVFLDGVNLREISSDDLYASMAVVGQETYIFDDTLEFNLTVGCGGPGKVTKEQLHEVVRTSGLGQAWYRFKNGFDTMLGQNGVKLSGGERQRIAIARALLMNTPILMLDEATSQVDVTNERYIKEQIAIVRQGRTLIAIAHRLSTVMAADIIFVVVEGRVVSQGKHDELKRACPVYAEMVKNHQFIEEVDENEVSCASAVA